NGTETTVKPFNFGAYFNANVGTSYSRTNKIYTSVSHQRRFERDTVTVDKTALASAYAGAAFGATSTPFIAQKGLDKSDSDSLNSESWTTDGETLEDVRWIEKTNTTNGFDDYVHSKKGQKRLKADPNARNFLDKIKRTQETYGLFASALHGFT